MRALAGPLEQLQDTALHIGQLQVKRAIAEPASVFSLCAFLSLLL